MLQRKPDNGRENLTRLEKHSLLGTLICKQNRSPIQRLRLGIYYKEFQTNKTLPI